MNQVQELRFDSILVRLKGQNRKVMLPQVYVSIPYWFD